MGMTLADSRIECLWAPFLCDRGLQRPKEVDGRELPLLAFLFSLPLRPDLQHDVTVDLDPIVGQIGGLVQHRFMHEWWSDENDGQRAFAVGDEVRRLWGGETFEHGPEILFELIDVDPTSGCQFRRERVVGAYCVTKSARS